MARVKEFDRETALQAAIATFAAHGYEGTSVDALMRSMKIGRQSMYDTFGDKKQLYLAALRKYGQDSFDQTLALLESGGSPLAGIEAVLVDYARRPRKRELACLGVGSVCEFGRSDGDIAAINDELGRQLEKAFEQKVAAAIAAGEVDEEVNPKDAARYLSVALCGIKVAAEAGTSPAHLTSVAKMTLRSLGVLRSG